jgi:hypothetical protein
MNSWLAYDDGRTIGRVNSEGGVILNDEEYLKGARITLKRGEKIVSVSCNIYGWINHTRFFSGVPEAERDFIVMKKELGRIMEIITAEEVDSLKGWEAISEFVRRFP